MFFQLSCHVFTLWFFTLQWATSSPAERWKIGRICLSKKTWPSPATSMRRHPGTHDFSRRLRIRWHRVVWVRSKRRVGERKKKHGRSLQVTEKSIRIHGKILLHSVSKFNDPIHATSEKSQSSPLKETTRPPISSRVWNPVAWENKERGAIWGSWQGVCFASK